MSLLNSYFCRKWGLLGNQARTKTKLLTTVFSRFLGLAVLVRGHFSTTLTGFWLFFDHRPSSIDIFYPINVDKESTFLDYLRTSSCQCRLWTTTYFGYHSKGWLSETPSFSFLVCCSRTEFWLSCSFLVRDTNSGLRQRKPQHLRKTIEASVEKARNLIFSPIFGSLALIRLIIFDFFSIFDFDPFLKKFIF